MQVLRKKPSLTRIICQEPSHPGSEDFDRNKMNEIAGGLSDENPCKHLGVI